jgi:hypothetical protein
MAEERVLSLKRAALERNWESWGTFIRRRGLRLS